MSRVRIPGRSRHIQITRREILGTSDALSILKLTSPPPPSNVDLASGFTSGMAAFKFLEHDDTKLHLFVSASMHCKNQNIKSNEKSINKIAKNRCRALKQDIDVCIKITIQTRPQQYNWKKKYTEKKNGHLFIEMIICQSSVELRVVEEISISENWTRINDFLIRNIKIQKYPKCFS